MALRGKIGLIHDLRLTTTLDQGRKEGHGGIPATYAE
jgi:hypothetical protein